MPTAVTLAGVDALSSGAAITTSNTTPNLAGVSIAAGHTTVTADSASSVRGSGNGIKIAWDATNGAGDYRMTLPSPGTAQVASNHFRRRVYYKTTTGAGADITLFQLNASAARAFTLLRRQTNGAFRILDAGNAALDSDIATVAATDATWYRIEMEADNTAGSGASTLIVRIYTLAGTKIYEKNITNANISTGAFNQMRTGASGYNATPGSHSFDADIWSDGGTGEFGPFTVPQTSARPLGVTSNAGAFVNTGGAASIQAALADELNTTYAISPDNPTGAVVEVNLTDVSHPLASGQATVLVSLDLDAASPAQTTTVDLYSDGTKISSRTYTPPANTITAYSWQPNTAEQAALAATSLTDVRLRFTTTI